MKKYSILSLFVILFTAISLTSCETEPLDSELDLNDFISDSNPNSNGSGNNNSGGGVSTGDYWPTTINNEWTFNQNGVALEPMKIVSTSSIGGATYYNFNNLFGQGTSTTANVAMSVKKDNGDYYIKVGDINSDAGGLTFVTTGYEFIALKDYLDVNGTWNGSFSQTSTYSDPNIPSITYNSTYIGTILEKGITVTVGGESFNNVIKFKISQTTNILGQSTVSETTYWYAKDVGPIKSSIASQGQSYVNELSSYMLF
jgi:hypothetical protein